MKLNKNILHQKINQIDFPKYSLDDVYENTKEAPIWVHFGAGNIFRGYIARLQDELLNQGLSDKGIIAVETFDSEIIDRIYSPHDNLTLLATLRANSNPNYRVIASISDAFALNQISFQKLKNIFAKETLQMVSFTITEKGYSLKGPDKMYLPIITQDIKNGPEHPNHTMAILCSMLFERFKKGGFPIAVVSMDNCSHNGEKIQIAVLTIALEWEKKGFVSKEFIEYLKDENKVTFPWSMIDKITPRPAASVCSALEELGFEDISPITTLKKTFIAPFVNAESCEYLVIEEAFPNGRPPLEVAGVYFTDRVTVNMVETMKVTTCLNPLHTALAVFGCLLGYESVAEEMTSTELRRLVEGIGREGIQVVVDPKIISPQAFLDEVLLERLPNKAIPDTPQRIATDTSQKIPVRYGETLKAYLASPTLNVDDLIFIPLAIAGWCRYILGLDDQWHEFELSSDPMLQYLGAIVSPIKEKMEYHGELEKILSNQQIFGFDVTKTSLFSKIENFFLQMIANKGAIIKTLKKYTS